MIEKTKLQQISDLAFDIQHTNDPQVAFDKAGEILRLTELDQPPFAVGEYYVYNTTIFKVVEIEEYPDAKDIKLHVLALCEGAIYEDTFEITYPFTDDKPATAEQVALFKIAEYLNKTNVKNNELKAILSNLIQEDD